MIDVEVWFYEFCAHILKTMFLHGFHGESFYVFFFMLLLLMSVIGIIMNEVLGSAAKHFLQLQLKFPQLRMDKFVWIYKLFFIYTNFKGCL